jgi:hypothetical protein
VLSQADNASLTHSIHGWFYDEGEPTPTLNGDARVGFRIEIVWDALLGHQEMNMNITGGFIEGNANFGAPDTTNGRVL